MAHDVFVSYSAKDKLVAEAIVARLETGSIRCWIAPRDVIPGADWGESIIDAIESSRIMVLVFSQSANESSQIKREVERATDKGVYIIPFRVDNIKPTKSLEYFISNSQWMDAFPPPLERHFDTLARTVGAILTGRPPPIPPGPKPMPPSPSPLPSPLLSRVWMVVVPAFLLAGIAWYFFTHRTSEPVMPQPTPTSSPIATIALSTATVAPSESASPIAAPSPIGQTIPKIAGVWHDGDNPNNVSQFTQDGANFTFVRGGVLPDGTQFKASGSGTTSGLHISLNYRAMYQPLYQTSFNSSGGCSGSVSADGLHMELSCRDSVLGYFAGEANHE